MGWLRHPKTTQERRLTNTRGYVLDCDGYNVRIRAKRNRRNLVNAYDDIHNDSWRDRSWKRHRKNQYKI